MGVSLEQYRSAIGKHSLNANALNSKAKLNPVFSWILAKWYQFLTHDYVIPSHANTFYPRFNMGNYTDQYYSEILQSFSTQQPNTSQYSMNIPSANTNSDNEIHYKFDEHAFGQNIKFANTKQKDHVMDDLSHGFMDTNLSRISSNHKLIVNQPSVQTYYDCVTEFADNNHVSNDCIITEVSQFCSNDKLIVNQPTMEIFYDCMTELTEDKTDISSISQFCSDETCHESIIVQCCMFLHSIDTYDILNLLYISALLLLLACDVESNPGPIEGCNSQKTLSGTLSQGAYKFIKDNGINTCMANSVSAIIYSTILSPEFWMQNDIDYVLDQGHDIYKHLHSIGKCEDDGTIICDNICTTHQCYGELYRCDKLCETFYSTIEVDPFGVYDYAQVSFHDALTIALAQSNYCVFMLYGYGSAIFKSANKLFMYDPHSRSSLSGILDPNGTAVLIEFDCIQHLVQHIYRLASSLTTQPMHRVYYEILPISVINMSKFNKLQILTRNSIALCYMQTKSLLNWKMADIQTIDNLAISIIEQSNVTDQTFHIAMNTHTYTQYLMEIDKHLHSMFNYTLKVVKTLKGQINLHNELQYNMRPCNFETQINQGLLETKLCGVHVNGFPVIITSSNTKYYVYFGTAEPVYLLQGRSVNRYIYEFDSLESLCTGINLPAVCWCNGSCNGSNNDQRVHH